MCLLTPTPSIVFSPPIVERRARSPPTLPGRGQSRSWWGRRSPLPPVDPRTWRPVSTRDWFPEPRAQVWRDRFPSPPPSPHRPFGPRPIQDPIHGARSGRGAARPLLPIRAFGDHVSAADCVQQPAANVGSRMQEGWDRPAGDGGAAGLGPRAGCNQGTRARRWEAEYAHQLPVGAIMEIQADYELKRNWMGDPCAPKNYAWDGIDCSYVSKLPRIIALNLSSSGLTGEISGSLANLQAITSLDLSNNNLTGNIPDFLVDLPSLKVLNLKNNQLNGPIPCILLQQYNSKRLDLSTEGNPNLYTGGGSCVKKKKKSSMLTIVIASVVSILIIIIILFILWRIRGARKQALFIVVEEEVHHDGHFIEENRVFTEEDLKHITHGFHKAIGKGGFGTVYHGHLANGTEVAVKVLSPSSKQGTKEFLSEGQILTRVHHKNLVKLIGYCKDMNSLALVYEYMEEGSLGEHLRGKHSRSSNLNWGERVRIAVEAAQGLEYLHKGCSPSIIHGDIKSANILLCQRFKAKQADFGLSKSLINNEDTHVSTNVGGTRGYLDPAFYRTNKLNEKSDVYSFGVVLLELVTGKPALLEGDSEPVHILQWVLDREDISDVADPKLQGDYDNNSVLNVVNIARKCTSEASIDRPMMTDVVIQLKESLALETARVRPERAEHSGPISLDTVLSAR